MKPETVSTLRALSGSRFEWLGNVAVVAPGRDALAVFIENMKARLCPSDMEVVQYWSEPSRRDADFERAEFERVRATTPTYFYDRKAAL